jgi:hypothetical protein
MIDLFIILRACAICPATQRNATAHPWRSISVMTWNNMTLLTHSNTDQIWKRAILFAVFFGFFLCFNHGRRVIL